MVATRAEAENIERFTDRYRLCCSPVQARHREARHSTPTTGRPATRPAPRPTTSPDTSGSGPATVSPTSVRVRAGPACTSPSRPGASVVGTDLPFDGLQRARARSITDGLTGRASYAVATGRTQPFRAGSFDAVVHTDVLCCLGPKLAVLRACHRLLRPGGRLAFTTIHVAADLDAARHRRAVRAGPWQVATRRPYPELVVQAGFGDVVDIDVTEDYARTQRAWLRGQRVTCRRGPTAHLRH